MSLNDGWRADALCQQVGTDLWFPEKGFWGERKAKKICGECVVRQSCRDYALERRERDGIWGGHLLTTVEGRRAALSESSVQIPEGDPYLILDGELYVEGEPDSEDDPPLSP